MKTTLILTFLLTALICFGQKEHLEPAKEFNSNDSTRYGKYYSKSKEYRDSIYTLLYSGFSQKPYARYSVSPAFRAEYAFSLENINKKNYVISNKFSEYYWYALLDGRQDSVKLNTNKTEISNELYLKIGELFGLLTDQAKEEERKFVVGKNGEILEEKVARLDGETYSFTTTDKNGEIRTGTTWSPRPHKQPMLSRLVKTCDDLFSIGAENNFSQTDILNEIEILINYFKN